MGRAWRAVAASASVGVWLLGAPAAGQGQAIEVGHIPVCFEAVPAVVAAPVGPPLEVRVHVVLDEGVTLADGRRVMERAQVAYEPIGLRLVPSFTTAHTSSDSSRDLLGELKGMFGGERPPWAHVVYLLTRRDIDNGPVAGVADCIGGVAFAERAFAIGEVGDDEHPTIGPLALFADGSAKIAAHEVGHLFGAHHHYANCIEGNTDAATEVSPCTLMFNDVGLVSLRFTVANSAIVRGHAVTYLQPPTAAPPPDGSPTLPPLARACDLRVYRDSEGDHANLVVNNPDDVDLLMGSFHTTVEAGREVVRFRWKLASLDGDFGPAATSVVYVLEIRTPRALTIEASWDGENAPTARALEEGSAVEVLPARLTPGPGGVIEVELPLEQLRLSGEDIALGLLRAYTNVDRTIDYDTAQPMVQAVRPAACAEPAAGAPASPAAPSGRPPTAAPLRVALLPTSVRQAVRLRRLRVRVAGSAQFVQVRLLDRRGRPVARGSARRVDGRRVVALRLVRRPRPGRHVLDVVGRAAGRRFHHRRPVRLER